jgi:hypothetical protein
MQVEGGVPKSKTVMKYLILMMLLLFVSRTGVAQTAQTLVLTANVSQSECAGSGHTIALVASGGTAPYTYRWSDGSTGSFRKELKAGTYTCTVTDANANVTQKTFRLQSLPSPLQVQVSKVLVAGKYQVQAEVSGGKAPYHYYWFGSGLEAGKSAAASQLLSAGIYQLAIQDSNGCSTSVSITLDK